MRPRGTRWGFWGPAVRPPGTRRRWWGASREAPRDPLGVLGTSREASGTAPNSSALRVGRDDGISDRLWSDLRGNRSAKRRAQSVPPAIPRGPQSRATSADAAAGLRARARGPPCGRECLVADALATHAVDPVEPRASDTAVDRHAQAGGMAACRGRGWRPATPPCPGRAESRLQPAASRAQTPQKSASKAGGVYHASTVAGRPGARAPGRQPHRPPIRAKGSRTAVSQRRPLRPPVVHLLLLLLLLARATPSRSHTSSSARSAAASSASREPSLSIVMSAMRLFCSLGSCAAMRVLTCVSS